MERLERVTEQESANPTVEPPRAAVPRVQRSVGAVPLRRLIDNALAATLPAPLRAGTSPVRIQREVAPDDVGKLDTEIAELHKAKAGKKAVKADFEPIAARIGNGCTWNDVKKAYNAYNASQQAPAAALPVRQITRAKLASVTSGESGGQRYTKTKVHAGLEYHVSVEYEPTSTKPAERNTSDVRIKKLHVSFESPGNKDQAKKDRYWYHWSSNKFAFDSRAGRNHGNMQAKADEEIRALLPKLNCPAL